MRVTDTPMRTKSTKHTKINILGALCALGDLGVGP